MNSFIPWIGGKKLLRKEIIKLFPGNFDRYIEVFGGAGWVLFAEDRHAELEVYNDINQDLVNLFRCNKYHCEELQREVKSLCLNSRQLFSEFKEQMKCDGFTDIQRAAKFYFLIRSSFAAKGSTFGSISRNIYDSVVFLESTQERLKRVVIENKDFDKLIQQYDRPDALFYCDPPYHKTEKYYTSGFKKEDHIRLHDTLCKIKGRFILSYNNDDFIRDMYKEFRIVEISRTNNISSASDSQFKELIIMKY